MNKIVLLGASWVFLFFLNAEAQEVAKVNQTPITAKELDFALKSIPPTTRLNMGSEKEARQIILQNLIDREVLVQSALTLKLENDPEFQFAIESARKQFLADLAARRLTDELVNDASARKYYASRKNEFSTASVRVQHILLEDPSTARTVLSQAVQKPDSFSELAEKHSKDKSVKINRGDMGFVQRGQLAPEMTQAIFTNDLGVVNKVVKTTFGYHVIKILDRDPGRVPSFEEVEAEVYRQVREFEVRRVISRMRSKAKITVSK